MIRILVFLLCCTGLANASEWGGQVENFYINSSGTALLKVVNTNGEAPGNCAVGLWPFTFRMDAPVSKEWVSMLLMAMASDRNIRVGFNGNTSGARCSISYLYFRGS